MSDIGRELGIMLQAALREAAIRRHSYVTVEHVLYAMIHDAAGGEILRHSGANLPALKAALERYFDEDLEQVPGDEPYETLQTLAFLAISSHIRTMLTGIINTRYYLL